MCVRNCVLFWFMTSCNLVVGFLEKKTAVMFRVTWRYTKHFSDKKIFV
jgi:hypothetical protein